MINLPNDFRQPINFFYAMVVQQARTLALTVGSITLCEAQIINES